MAAARQPFAVLTPNVQPQQQASPIAKPAGPAHDQDAAPVPQLRFSTGAAQKAQPANNRYSPRHVDTPGSSSSSFAGDTVPSVAPPALYNTAQDAPGWSMSREAPTKHRASDRYGAASGSPVQSSGSSSQPQMGTPSLRSQYSSQAYSQAGTAASRDALCEQSTADSQRVAKALSGCSAVTATLHSAQPALPPAVQIHELARVHSLTGQQAGLEAISDNVEIFPASAAQRLRSVGSAPASPVRPWAAPQCSAGQSVATIRGFLAARSIELRAALQVAELAEHPCVTIGSQPGMARAAAPALAPAADVHDEDLSLKEQDVAALSSSLVCAEPRTSDAASREVADGGSTADIDMERLHKLPSRQARMSAALQAQLLRNQPGYMAQFQRRKPQPSRRSDLLRRSADAALPEVSHSTAAACTAPEGAPAVGGASLRPSKATFGSCQLTQGGRRPMSCPVTPSKPIVSKTRKPTVGAKPGLGYRNSAVPARQVITAQLADPASIQERILGVTHRSHQHGPGQALRPVHQQSAAPQPTLAPSLPPILQEHALVPAVDQQLAPCQDGGEPSAPLPGLSAATQAWLAAALAHSPHRRAESAVAAQHAAAISARAEERMQVLKAMIHAHQQRAAQRSIASRHGVQDAHAYDLAQQLSHAEHDLTLSREASHVNHRHAVNQRTSMASQEGHAAAQALLQGLMDTWPGDELLPAKCRAILPRLVRPDMLRGAHAEAGSPAEKQVYELTELGMNQSRPDSTCGPSRISAAPSCLACSFAQVAERSISQPRISRSRVTSSASSTSNSTHQADDDVNRRGGLLSSRSGRRATTASQQHQHAVPSEAHAGTTLRQPQHERRAAVGGDLPSKAGHDHGGWPADVHGARQQGPVRQQRPAVEAQSTGSADSILAIAEWDLTELCGDPSDMPCTDGVHAGSAPVRTSHASIQDLLAAERSTAPHSAARSRRQAIRDSAEAGMFGDAAGPAGKAAQHSRLSLAATSNGHAERAVQAAQRMLGHTDLGELQQDLVQCIFLHERGAHAPDGAGSALTSSPVNSLLERRRSGEREYAVIGKLEVPDSASPGSNRHARGSASAADGTLRQPIYLLASAARRYERGHSDRASAAPATANGLSSSVDTGAAASRQSQAGRPLAGCGCWGLHPRVQGSPEQVSLAHADNSCTTAAWRLDSDEHLMRSPGKGAHSKADKGSTAERQANASACGPAVVAAAPSDALTCGPCPTRSDAAIPAAELSEPTEHAQHDHSANMLDAASSGHPAMQEAAHSVDAGLTGEVQSEPQPHKVLQSVADPDSMRSAAAQQRQHAREDQAVGQMLGDSWNVIAGLTSEGSFTVPDLGERRHASVSVRAAGKGALRSLRASADNLFGRTGAARSYLHRHLSSSRGQAGDNLAAHWARQQADDGSIDVENSPLQLGLLKPYS